MRSGWGGHAQRGIVGTMTFITAGSEEKLLLYTASRIYARQVTVNMQGSASPEQLLQIAREALTTAFALVEASLQFGKGADDL